MLDFDFCNALPVRARVGSGTITAIYYYYYYYYFTEFTYTRRNLCSFEIAMTTIAQQCHRGLTI